VSSLINFTRDRGSFLNKCCVLMYLYFLIFRFLYVIPAFVLSLLGFI
jgi:hypothetical protein